MIPAFPKPGQIKRVKPAFKVLRDGREICDLLTKAGRDEYMSRKVKMHTRQNGICCLYGHAPGCPGRLSKYDMMFEHEEGRTAGHRDDRIERLNRETGKMERINGVAHPVCNSWKGSRKILYNAA